MPRGFHETAEQRARIAARLRGRVLSVAQRQAISRGERKHAEILAFAPDGPEKPGKPVSPGSPGRARSPGTPSVPQSF